MTEQEMLARIKELEEENAELREYAQSRKTVRPICPDWVGEKYGGKKLQRGHVVSSFPFMTNTELADASKLVRKTCFPKEDSQRKRGRSNSKVTIHSAKKVDDMTAEEYERYGKILDEVLAVLSKYAFRQGALKQ